MSLSPVDNAHLCNPRLDLAGYFLNTICACPGCDREATDNHHIFRRSLGKGYRDAWWVELPDGTVVPNRVGLCQHHHRQITENQARIAWEGNRSYWWWGVVAGSRLDPHPPLEPAKQLEIAEPHVHEGDTCPTCSRRVPHRKKATSPTSKVFSVRVPIDDAETFAEVVDAAAEHLGVKSKPHHRFVALQLACAFVLQAPKKDFDV